ncbi:MAG: DUF192 domain-containing protein [DPANN group archaeon]|nr:DUF192 domain-containing protein [DPANN group archaeon]
MSIENRTKRRLLASRKTVASGIFQKALGLMFAKPIVDEGLVMVFSRMKRIDLHMIAVFFPIDILWLDDRKDVVALFERARPFLTHIRGPPKAQYVIELPAGIISRTATTIGDNITF